MYFNDMLDRNGYDLHSVRFVRHQESGALKGRTAFELWRDRRAEFDEYQSQHSIDKHSILRSATHWASFVATPGNDTLFVGLYRTRYIAPSTTEIKSATTGKLWESGKLYLYEVVPESFLSSYIGRLFIDWGPGKRSWVQYMDRHVKPIVELTRVFKEEAFPGYLQFRTDLSQLSIMPQAWKAALSAASGVYVLTCPRTKEMYIGSAYGVDGFLGRWMQYASDGHGGNVQLRSRDRSDYQVSILEVAGSAATAEDILALESRWKAKLQTRDMGLNAN